MGRLLPPRSPLPRRFFARGTVTVARELIGCTLWTVHAGEVTAGRIVETEAYLDESDPASHAASGPTTRSGVMFGPPGVLYVYLIYGMHHCLNFVTEREGQAGAVLVRALEPLVGIAIMRRRRGLSARGRGEDLCAGPGRLGRALGVDLLWNGLPLENPTAKQQPQANRVWVAHGQAAAQVAAGPRIGIRQAQGRPFRFCDPHSACLSRPARDLPAASGRRAPGIL